MNPFLDLSANKEKDPALFDMSLTESEEIVNQCIGAIKDSDGVCAIIDDSQTYGTIMEIVYTTLLRKPLFLIVTNGWAKHPWFQYHARGKVFTSLKQFEKEILKVKY